MVVILAARAFFFFLSRVRRVAAPRHGADKNAQTAQKQTDEGAGQGADVLRKRLADKSAEQQGGQQTQEQARSPASQDADFELAQFPGEHQQRDARRSASGQARHAVRREQGFGERPSEYAAKDDEKSTQNQAQAAQPSLFFQGYLLQRYL